MAVAAQSLKLCSLFAGFTDTGLAILAEVTHARDLAAGQMLFAQGAVADSLFLIETGQLEIWAGEGKAAKKLCELGPGASLGEMALMRPGRRAVHARAKVATRILEIRRSDFNEILKIKPQACIKLMLSAFGAVERRLDATKDDLLSLV